MPPNFAEKTFTNSHKTAKFAKVFSLKVSCYVFYSWRPLLAFVSSSYRTQGQSSPQHGYMYMYACIEVCHCVTPVLRIMCMVRAPRFRLVQNLNFIDSGLDLYHGLIFGLSFGTTCSLKCSQIVAFWVPQPCILCGIGKKVCAGGRWKQDISLNCVCSNTTQFWTPDGAIMVLLSLVPRGLPRLHFLIACSMQKWSQKAWWILPCDLRYSWRHRY